MFNQVNRHYLSRARNLRGGRELGGEDNVWRNEHRAHVKRMDCGANPSGSTEIQLCRSVPFAPGQYRSI